MPCHAIATECGLTSLKLTHIISRLITENKAKQKNKIDVTNKTIALGFSIVVA